MSNENVDIAKGAHASFKQGDMDGCSVR
jgi:hypothetical protein